MRPTPPQSRAILVIGRRKTVKAGRSTSLQGLDGLFHDRRPAGPCCDVTQHEAQAWETARNAAQVKVNWQFTTADARIKLNKLYPSLEV